jgi:hypothetical protein
MSNVIIYTNENGNITVCIPTGEVPIQTVQENDVPKEVASYIVPFEFLPTEYDCFFDAWEQSNGVVSVNLTKSREIMKSYLRAQREPLLLRQDIAFQRALETNEDTTLILLEKQRLRDITKQVDDCYDLDTLKNIRC